MSKLPDDREVDSVQGIGDLWGEQDGQGSDFDYGMYNSVPWVIIKTILALGIMTMAYLLYALRELPWGLFDSATGILILAAAPFFAGMMLGFTFENQKLALGYSVLLGMISIGLCFFLMMLPYEMELADYGPVFMKDVWYYGFFVPFIVTISFVPAGAMLSASTNAYN